MILISSASNENEMKLKGAVRELRLSRAYGDAISAAGGVPVLSAEQNAEELAEVCDGLLLSGGDDIEPELFGETKLNASVKLDPARTDNEYALIEAFRRREKPVFGICRGFQLLNVYYGGSLYQDMTVQKGWFHMVPHLLHDITCDRNSILGELYGEQVQVNSTHHQGICKLGEGLRPTAWSENGQLIEAWEHEQEPVFGVQFHPERMTGKYKWEEMHDFSGLFAYYIDFVKKSMIY